MRTAWVCLVLLAAGCAVSQVKQVEPTPETPQPVGIWTMEGGGPGRASRVAFAVPLPLESRRVTTLMADREYRPEEYATPVVIDGIAYVGHTGRSFAAVRLEDGSILWKVATPGKVYTTAAYADGLMIFGDDHGKVRAVDLSGKEAWGFPARYPVVASPLVAQGRVYIAVADQNVFCLEAATGRPLWQYGRKFPRRNALWRSLGLSFGDGRVYAGFADGTVVALDAEVGEVLWRVEAGTHDLFGDVTAGPAYYDGRVYAGAFRGPVVCLEAASGKEIWRKDVETASGFAVGDELLYAGTPAGSLLALSRSNGEVIWEAALDGGVPTRPVLAGDTVLVGASEGSLFAIEAETGAERDRYGAGPGLHAQPLVFEEGVVFLSDGGALHWLQ